MKLKLFYNGASAIVTSEKAAKEWARKALGVTRLTETPTETGWQYWRSKVDDDPVTVRVLEERTGNRNDDAEQEAIDERERNAGQRGLRAELKELERPPWGPETDTERRHRLGEILDKRAEIYAASVPEDETDSTIRAIERLGHRASTVERIALGILYGRLNDRDR